MPRILDGRLSPAQLAALRLAANGLTSEQIAVRVGSTRNAINVLFTRAATSLGASSRTHAVAICLARGLIRLDEVRLPVTAQRLRESA